jgi:arabinofuranosyltransferase
MPVHRSTRAPAVLVMCGVLLLLFAALLVHVCQAAFQHRGMTVDDGFIVFRYAENLVAGHGFRWNATSSPSEGFSSTVSVVGVAGLIRTGMDPVVAQMVLNLAGAVAMTAGLLAACGIRTWAAPVTCLPALYVVTDPNFVVHTSRGLETLLFMAMAVLLILLAGRVVRAAAPRSRGFIGLALACLLLGLSRPEAPLIAGACWLVAALILWRRGEPLREMIAGTGVGIVGVAAYLAWRVWYFGAPLPTPYYVKANLPTWMGVRDAIAFAVEYRELLLPAAMVSIVCWVLFLRRSATVTTPPLEALAVMVIAPPWLLYSARILHETGYNHRLSYPLVGMAALGLVSGLHFLLVMMFPRPRRALHATAIVALVAGVAAVAPRIEAARQDLRQPEPVDPYVASFIKVGRAVGSLGLGDTITFVTPVAGAMPYFSRARHIDPFGLASDELSRRRPRAERKRFMETLRWDVATFVVPPATPGAIDAASDPLFRTPYFTKWVIPAGEWVAQYDVLLDPEIGWLEFHHSEMRKLRDTATLVAMIAPPVRMDPPQAWLHFVYVSRASKHHDALVAALRGAAVPAVPESSHRTARR